MQARYDASFYHDGSGTLKPLGQFGSNSVDYMACTEGIIKQPFGYYCELGGGNRLSCDDTLHCIVRTQLRVPRFCSCAAS